MDHISQTQIDQELGKIDACAKKALSLCDVPPALAVVLGSGWGAFAAEVEDSKSILYSELPHFPRPSVEGHSGKLVVGKIGNVRVVVLQGRVHYYEGYSPAEVVFPIRVLARMGIKTLIVTNASGGLSAAMKPGDFMLIQDHINMTGWNPLIGPNFSGLGPRFPDMSAAYSPRLREHFANILKRQNIRYTEGVYMGLTGPTYETPSEVRLYQQMGAQAVGMSTVPEVIVAAHAGIETVGISCITNLGTGLTKERLTHEDVTEQAKRVETLFCRFLTEAIKTLP